MLPALPGVSPVSEVRWPASSSGTSSLGVMHSNAISEIKPKSPGFALVLAQHVHSVACPWRPHTAGEKKGEFNTAQSFYVVFMLLPGREIIQYKHKSRALISKLSWLYFESNSPISCCFLHAVWGMGQKARRPALTSSSGVAMNLGISLTTLALPSVFWSFIFQIMHGHLWRAM